MILEKIRKVSAQHHAAIEQNTLMLSLGDGSTTISQYLDVLRKFYGFFKPLEDFLSGFMLAEVIPDYEERRKAKLLLNDLRILGENNLPEMHVQATGVKSLAFAIGCLYVLEGSSLGGKIITANLEKSLGILPTTGSSFFYGYGPDTGKKWKYFVEQLIKFGLTLNEEQERALMDGVTHTFSSLHNWLNTSQMSYNV